MWSTQSSENTYEVQKIQPPRYTELSGDPVPKISFLKNRAPIEVEDGANLMRALQKADIPVASSCNGDGVCVKCRMQIIEGSENLSPVGELEEHLKERHDLSRNERVSCQVQVHGDVKVHATYW